MGKTMSRTSRHGDPVRAAVFDALEPNDFPWAGYYDVKRRTDHCVYAIYVPEIRRLKIGYTRLGVAARVRALRREYPELAAFRFDVLGTIDGGRSMERVVHERYAAHRVSREWFSDAIVEDVRSLIAEDGEWFGGFS